MKSDTATQAIVQEANEWLVRLHDPESRPGEQAAFGAWLRQSPVHVREYLRAEAVWSAMAEIDSGKGTDIQALLDTRQDNVVPIDRQMVTGAAHAKPLRTRRWALGTAVAAALVIAGGGTWYLEMTDSVRYVTGVGEQRRVVLDDGSVVEMNTQTEITVYMNESGRYVDLESGEALFTVAKNVERPFIVDGELATVRALGTQFNVYRQTDRVVVTVLEGRVAVEKAAAMHGERMQDANVKSSEQEHVELGQGYQARVAQGSIQKSEAKIAPTIAWRERRLIFDDQPLSAVVREFNRYNRRQLVINDPALASLRISAVFNADQPDALVRFLQQNMEIESEATGGRRLVIRLRDSN